MCRPSGVPSFNRNPFQLVCPPAERGDSIFVTMTALSKASVVRPYRVPEREIAYTFEIPFLDLTVEDFLYGSSYVLSLSVAAGDVTVEQVCQLYDCFLRHVESPINVYLSYAPPVLKAHYRLFKMRGIPGGTIFLLHDSEVEVFSSTKTTNTEIIIHSLVITVPRWLNEKNKANSAVAAD